VTLFLAGATTGLVLAPGIVSMATALPAAINAAAATAATTMMILGVLTILVTVNGAYVRLDGRAIRGGPHPSRDSPQASDDARCARGCAVDEMIGTPSGSAWSVG
jgi:hypothetical protein